MNASGRAAVHLVLLLTSGCGLVTNSSLGKQLKTGAGVAAKQICSLVYVSGLEPERARALYIDPMLREGASIIRIELDREAQTARARIPGVLDQTAIHREGYGCTLVNDENRGLSPATKARNPSRSMVLDPRHRDSVLDPAKLHAAVDREFQQDGWRRARPGDRLRDGLVGGGASLLRTRLP